MDNTDEFARRGSRRPRQIVADTYRHKNYSVREKLVSQFDAFLLDLRLTALEERVCLELADGRQGLTWLTLSTRTCHENAW